MRRMINMESRREIFAAGLLLFACSFAAACSTPEPAQPPASTTATVYEGARLITGDGSAPIENAVFVVDNNQFTQVGRSGEVTVPPGAARVNLAGKTVMPAIVDAHTHMPRERDALIQGLQRKAYYGVGALISLGQDVEDAPLQVREEVVPNGARFRSAGRGITAPEPGRPEVPYWVTTEAEARKAVQEQVARKVDFIKIWVDDRDDMYKKLTPALYGPIIDEAHKNNVRVVAHIYDLEDAKGLLRAGLDGFAHGVRDRDIDDEFVAMMKARPEVFLEPNLPDRGVATDLSWMSDTVPAEELKKLQAAATDRPDVQKFFGIQARNLAKLNAAGVKIALGTDGGNPLAHHLEMEDMVAAGMTPAQVIVASTRTAAEVLRIPEVGTVAAGKSADFLVLDANPLDDITNTRRISAVYLRGTAVDRAGIRAAWNGEGTR